MLIKTIETNENKNNRISKQLEQLAGSQSWAYMFLWRQSILSWLAERRMFQAVFFKDWAAAEEQRKKMWELIPGNCILAVGHIIIIALVSSFDKLLILRNYGTKQENAKNYPIRLEITWNGIDMAKL